MTSLLLTVAKACAKVVIFYASVKAIGFMIRGTSYILNKIRSL